VAARSGRLLADLVRRLATRDLDPPLPNREWVRWEAMPEREAAVAVPAWIEDATRRVQAKLRSLAAKREVGAFVDHRGARRTKPGVRRR
jgi:hypothetical protein